VTSGLWPLDVKWQSMLRIPLGTCSPEWIFTIPLVHSWVTGTYETDGRTDGRTDECIQQRGLLLGGTHNKVYKQLSQWIWENRDLWMKSYNYQKSTIGELSTNKPILMIGLRGEHAHSGVHHCDVCQIISTKYDRIGQSDVFHHPPQKAL